MCVLGLEGKHSVQGRLPPQPYCHSVVSLQRTENCLTPIQQNNLQKFGDIPPLLGTGELFCPSAMK